MVTFNQCIRVISLVITLSACGGGGGVGDTESSGNTDSEDTPNDQNINNGLTGRVYVNQENEGWIVDLSNGGASQLPDKGWWDTDDYTGRGIIFRAHPNQDASEFLLFVDNCYREYNRSSGDFDCLSFINASGDLVTNRATLTDGIRKAKPSKDGNYVAITYADEAYYDPSIQLVIYDRSFTSIISQSTMHVTGGGEDSKYYERGFDWSSNGQIAYAYTKSIFVTSSYSAEGVPIVTLPDSDSPMVDIYPVPAKPKFSPNGLKIAFLVSPGNGNTIWVVNVDGTDLHQLASYVGEVSFNRIAWSPDGEYILAGLGAASSFGYGGVPGSLYGIPSDSRDVQVPFSCEGENADIANQNGIICLRTYFNNPQYLTRKFDPWGSTFEWIE
ncbi:MAG: hypothetical protein P8163_22415 [Candidatus Thiodiazotropha sp.]